MSDLKNKRIIVTGGAGGIGNAAVRLFASRGARVTCTVHNSTPDLPQGVLARTCNISDRDDVIRTFAALVEEMGGLDVLVHAAGMHGTMAAEQIDAAHWNRMFDINVNATVWTNQAAFHHLKAQGGSIVNMGSVEGVRGFAGNAAYAASRGAVMAWTRTAALEWGASRVRVNCVAPAIATDIFKRQRAAMDPVTLAAVDESLRQRIPLGGTLGDALLDLAPVLAFLASDDSRFITGQTIAVDGGLMMLGS
ncbi:MAG: SDR family oxidoreductase [Proteobacteria bacterium]|nr:SDR family oxidoreductase [Pseudomonadota bacterium]HQR04039.1 SDR family oxidoreductase [Rhodocyclaceae bacterium]